MNLKLIQLPVPDLDYSYNEANIPLAAGYLKSYLVSRGILTEEEIKTIPRTVANWGGESAILEWIENSPTDWVGLTTYMWNLERNRWLAQQIKHRFPSVRVILGGPEIQPNHPILSHPDIDCFVIGEGEAALAEVMMDSFNQRPLKKIYQSTTYLDLATLPNPYLNSCLTIEGHESIFLETMRGCPYQCSYCFYSKTYSGIRFHEAGILPHVMNFAMDHSATEIYLLDPSFNITPHLHDRLEIIRQSNPARIPIHTEIRLESITEKIAKQMEAASFASVEVGLQTTHQPSLKAIGRKWNRKKFLDGVLRLQARGIIVKTGVILGLPYNSYQDWQKTLDFLFQAKLDQAMEIYPLSLIPGTILRDEAAHYGIQFMPEPPYWVTQTPYMSPLDMTEAITELEERTQTEYFPSLIPHLKNISPHYIHFIDLRNQSETKIQVIQNHPSKIANHLTILIQAKQNLDSLWILVDIIKTHSPFSLIQVILESDTIPPTKIGLQIAQSFDQPDHYFNRIHYYKNDHQTTFSVRLFHLTSNLETAAQYIERPMYYDLIVLYRDGLLSEGRLLLDEKPILWIPHKIPARVLSSLKRIYQDFENFLLLP